MKTSNNRLTTADVARVTGLCPQTVRHLMRTRLTFGQFITLGKRKEYYYSVFKIADWLGTTPENVLEMLNQSTTKGD